MTLPIQEKPASGVLCNALVADNGRTETVKERRWWEVKTWDSDAGCWRNAGNSPLREEIDRFIERAKRENFAVQVWEAVAVERTERVKQLETCSATNTMPNPQDHRPHAGSESPASPGSAALAILREITRLCNEGRRVGFESDWGGNTLTILIDTGHSHVGVPDGSEETLVDNLHSLLCKGSGLSWFVPPNDQSSETAEGGGGLA